MPSSSAEEALLRYIIDSIFLFAFMLALIFHSHQTEATYRLDFIWKLQATGFHHQHHHQRHHDCHLCQPCQQYDLATAALSLPTSTQRTENRCGESFKQAKA
ncbi:unnamed protein product [Ceratitis capitata]|uniref:(Mediterranean fruit fly) hypothetical protein n=1 Tax=Ceratitis capitata TaxID=7213 RepID=A0A811V0G0_CERCA|nr:unnamed protein product [Ceratitis capitata]